MHLAGASVSYGHIFFLTKLIYHNTLRKSLTKAFNVWKEAGFELVISV